MLCQGLSGQQGVPGPVSLSQASSSGPASPPPAGPASQAFSRTLKQWTWPYDKGQLSF